MKTQHSGWAFACASARMSAPAGLHLSTLSTLSLDQPPTPEANVRRADDPAESGLDLRSKPSYDHSNKPHMRSHHMLGRLATSMCIRHVSMDLECRCSEKYFLECHAFTRRCHPSSAPGQFRSQYTKAHNAPLTQTTPPHCTGFLSLASADGAFIRASLPSTDKATHGNSQNAGWWKHRGEENVVSRGIKRAAAGASGRRSATRIAEQLVGVGGIVATRGPSSSVLVLKKKLLCQQTSVVQQRRMAPRGKNTPIAYKQKIARTRIPAKCFRIVSAVFRRD